jgi:hypothetical protein
VDNVVNFPAKSARDWLLIERLMAEKLSKHSISPVVQAGLIERMKAFYEILDTDLSFSIDAPSLGDVSQEQVRTFCFDIGEKIGPIMSERIYAFTQKLFIERLNREIDVCRELGEWS